MLSCCVDMGDASRVMSPSHSQPEVCGGASLEASAQEGQSRDFMSLMQPHFPFLCRGVFVKLRDHHRHPECYVCTDCGTNLKQKGHFFVEDQIYCEKHARERVTPPEGYDVVTVFPK